MIAAIGCTCFCVVCILFSLVASVLQYVKSADAKKKVEQGERFGAKYEEAIIQQELEEQKQVCSVDTPPVYKK